MDQRTNFSVLSHACLLIKRGNISLIIDPWLLGSCYWRSWWNYPEPEIDKDELNQVTHVLISHIHWDHWHGKTLKTYFKDRKFLIPEEPKTRAYNDLLKLRLGPVSLIKHGETICLGEKIKITAYQFGLFQNDSAIIIETPEVTILNANDAKIAGAPLKQIIKKHKPIDFALRSHSTANYRACISVENNTIQPIDDNEHYSRAFTLFMDAVKPKYAVPFASNNCHLHQDTYHLNKLITNPIKLKNWIEEKGGLKFSELVIMLPGSRWDSQDGFNLKGLEPFINLKQKLKEYKQKKTITLDNYYIYESNQDLNIKSIQQHESHLKSIPWIFRFWLKNISISYKIYKNPEESFYFSIDYIRCKLTEICASTYQKTPIRIVWPILVFKQSISLNMYSHAFISKRVLFNVNKEKDLRKLTHYLSGLENVEHEVFPIRWNYIKRLFSAYCRRWREVWVYISVIKQVLIHKKTLPIVEEMVLRKSDL